MKADGDLIEAMDDWILWTLCSFRPHSIAPSLVFTVAEMGVPVLSGGEYMVSDTLEVGGACPPMRIDLSRAAHPPARAPAVGGPQLLAAPGEAHLRNL